MADENPLGPQPDFNLICDEIKKAQNLPAVVGGQRILEELLGIRQDLRNARRDLMSMIIAGYESPLAVLPLEY